MYVCMYVCMYVIVCIYVCTGRSNHCYLTHCQKRPHDVNVRVHGRKIQRGLCADMHGIERVHSMSIYRMQSAKYGEDIQRIRRRIGRTRQPICTMQTTKKIQRRYATNKRQC